MTNVRLDSDDRTIIVDTKFYKAALKRHYGREILISDNLYQLFTYMKNIRPTLPPERRLEGMLLYPAAKAEVDVRFVVQGLPIRVVTVNLGQHWTKISDDLLGLLSVDNSASSPLVPAAA